MMEGFWQNVAWMVFIPVMAVGGLLLALFILKVAIGFFS